MTYKPPPVSKHYRFDWQFALKYVRLPLLLPASMIISLMPLLTWASTTLCGVEIIRIPLSAWILWLAAIAFLAACGVFWIWCPAIVQQYQNFGQYASFHHSHRWIVWLFYNTITSLTAWQRIVRETLAKDVSVRVGDARNAAEYGVCPRLVRRDSESEYVPFVAPVSKDKVVVFAPEQVGRDIYVPLHCDGERLLLLLQESDPRLASKEKELFWILLTQAVKEAPRARMAFWILLGIAAALFLVNVLTVAAGIWRFTLSG